MLVNIVDVPPLCNFILPRSSAPAARDRDLDGRRVARTGQAHQAPDREEFGPEYARLAIMLNDVRGWAKGTLPTYQDRKAFFEAIVNGEPDPIELLRAGDEDAVHGLIAAAQQAHAHAVA
jgi:siroheme synthase (precorrin-2 oxidase/ferrochelatase)